MQAVYLLRKLVERYREFYGIQIIWHLTTAVPWANDQNNVHQFILTYIPCN